MKARELVWKMTRPGMLANSTSALFACWCVQNAGLPMSPEEGDVLAAAREYVSGRCSCVTLEIALARVGTDSTAAWAGLSAHYMADNWEAGACAWKVAEASQDPDAAFAMQACYLMSLPFAERE